ncbi:hypothetical protein CRG98_034478 [Punica granatum]|uniref:Uncharacterized protein n=1 Tax=Punica granatum TaxID=22663 RepID=A0A2I0IM52_PUNGR|nr:hypothetical protein CRG98_034478 [Punica granatum]
MKNDGKVTKTPVNKLENLEESSQVNNTLRQVKSSEDVAPALQVHGGQGQESGTVIATPRVATPTRTIQVAADGSVPADHSLKIIKETLKRSSGKTSAIDMCIQAMHWDLCYILRGLTPCTFEELVTRAHNMELNFKTCGSQRLFVQGHWEVNDHQESNEEGKPPAETECEQVLAVNVDPISKKETFSTTPSYTAIAQTLIGFKPKGRDDQQTLLNKNKLHKPLFEA